MQSRRQIFRSTETEETLLIIEAGRQQKAEERNRYGRGHVARAIAGGLEGGLFFICKLSKVRRFLVRRSDQLAMADTVATRNASSKLVVYQ